MLNRFAGEVVGAGEEEEGAGDGEGDKQLPPQNVRWKPRPGNEAENAGLGLKCVHSQGTGAQK